MKPIVRRPSAAGQFYPAGESALQRIVETLLVEAEPPYLRDVRAVVVPHAGYPFSGSVAAMGFKTLFGLPQAVFTVYLLGPSHRVLVDGAGLTRATTFETPLGPVPVAVEAVAHLLEKGDPYRIADAAHQPEHCLEVELPFLQTALPQFSIVPLLCDDGAEPERVGADLAQVLATDPYSLLVVSSDLSHYHPYDEAVHLDWGFLADLAEGEVDAVSRGEACGRVPILCLMVIARRLAWRCHVLGYSNSGDTGGPRQRVVGYGAAAYTAEKGGN